MNKPADLRVAESLMEIVRADCARAAASTRWSDVLAWMSHELDAAADHLDLPDDTRRQMRDLAREAREVTRSARRAQAA